MARKQSKRALLLSTIRKERMVLTELKDHELCLRNIIKECEKIIQYGFTVSLSMPNHRKTLVDVDKDRLKTIMEMRKTQNKITMAEARIEDLEQQLAAEKAQSAVGCAGLEPGWRWIRGFENRYVWSTDGRVGTLKKNLLGDNWTLRLLKPVARGFFKLSIGNGVTIRKSFTMLAAESVDNPLLLKFSDEGLFTAVTLNGQKVIIRLPKGK